MKKVADFIFNIQTVCVINFDLQLLKIYKN